MLVSIGLPLGMHDGSAFRVRIADQVVALDETQYAIWRGASVWSEPGSWPGRTAVVAASAREPAVVGEVIDALIAAGLLVEVAEDLDSVARFAATYQAHPTAAVLQRSPENPDWYLVGTGESVVSFVEAALLDMYAFSEVSDSLLECAHNCAQVRAKSAGTDDPYANADYLVYYFVLQSAAMVARDALYFDLARRYTVQRVAAEASA